MASAWNLFVKKIFHEGKKNNKSYSFKEALKDASRRKGEMGSMSSSLSGKTAKKSRSKRGGGKKSRKNKKSKK